MSRDWNPLTGKFEVNTPITTDNKTTPYPTKTCQPMSCTKCHRVTNELHTDFIYPEEHLCPECYKATHPLPTTTFTESKEERCYRKLKKWLRREMKQLQKTNIEHTILNLVLQKMKQLEKDEQK